MKSSDIITLLTSRLEIYILRMLLLSELGHVENFFIDIDIIEHVCVLLAT